MTLTLLLHGKHHGTQVTYEPFGPWLVPWRISAFEEEYDALRQGTGLIDYSTQALIEVRGADRVAFLQNLLTNDLKPLSPGTGCRAALLTPNAKLIAELLVVADPEALWFLCDLTRAGTIVQTLEQYWFSEQVELINHERRQAVMALEGPRTIECLTRLAGAMVSLPRAGDHASVTLDGSAVRLIRHSLTSGVGVLCVTEAGEAESLWDACRRHGQPFGLKLVGWEALNTARIEAGIPWYGIDMDQEHLLPETGLETVVASDTKGCYVGQEIVARLATYGSVNKKLVGLVLNGDGVPRAGDRILHNGVEAGWVTSGCYSPALSRPIALGYVKRPLYDAGTAVEIVRSDARLQATVTTRPIVGG